MLERDTLYVLDYYKKNTFMGSIGNMNFRVYKVETEREKVEGAEPENELQLEAVCWPGPLIYDKTPEEKKIRQYFPYAEEGLVAITKWLNEQHDRLEER